MIMGGPGISEILVIAVIIVLIFGAKRLPSIGEGLGKTVKELRNIKKDMSKNKNKEKAKQVQEVEKASSGDDIADTIQKSVTKKVTDTVISQVPGIKQAKQLKDKADKIKKFVS